MPRIAIIGAGVAGLVSAALLGADGHDVHVFERSDRAGGKLGSLSRARHVFDIGPTVLTMRHVFDELFDRLGHRLEDHVSLVPVDPTCRYHWSDGTSFDAFSNRERRDAELDRVFPADADAYRAFLDDVRQLFDATADLFLYSRFDGLRELLRPANAGMLGVLPRLEPGRSLHESLQRRFRSAKLVQLFDRFATYNGSSPYLAPAVLKVIAHVEVGTGTWYPIGGMRSLADALLGLAVQQGVTMHYNAPVASLLRTADRIAGVETADRTRHPADVVISNADALWTYRNLLAQIGVRTPRALRTAPRSSSGMLIHARVRGRHPQLAHHNVFFTDDYRSEFTDIFELHRMPQQPTIYVSISSRTDSNLAPCGEENWYVLVNAPAEVSERFDKRGLETYAGRVWQRLREFGVDATVIDQHISGPEQFREQFNGVDGALYGSASHSMMSSFLRQRNRHSRLGNLYFAGGSVHPGGGVPLAALSGRITAGIVAEDHPRL